MNKTDRYRETLKSVADWEDYLMSESNLPGPRGNLELVAAVVQAHKENARAPENTPEAFLCVCGVAGLGKLLAEGRFEFLSELRQYAGDPRWRIREAVVMALERLGRVGMDRLLEEMEVWSQGSLARARGFAGAGQGDLFTRRRTSTRR